MCTLNEEDMCLGCGRLLNEIMSWTSYSDQQRDDILRQCIDRQRELDKGSPLLEQARKKAIRNAE